MGQWFQRKTKAFPKRLSLIPLNGMNTATGHWFPLKIMASTKRNSFD